MKTDEIKNKVTYLLKGAFTQQYYKTNFTILQLL